MAAIKVECHAEGDVQSAAAVQVRLLRRRVAREAGDGDVDMTAARPASSRWRCRTARGHGVQPAAAASGHVPEAVSSASERVREEWRARIAAEYTSAAITQHLVLWLIQAGAPPDLIDAGLAIVADELVHSRMSHEVYVAAGGTQPPAIDRDAARPRAHDASRSSSTSCASRSACSASARPSRCRCSRTCASTAPSRPRAPRSIGSCATRFATATSAGTCSTGCSRSPIGDAIPRGSRAQLPAMLAELEASYGTGNPTVADDDRRR